MALNSLMVLFLGLNVFYEILKTLSKNTINVLYLDLNSQAIEEFLSTKFHYDKIVSTMFIDLLAASGKKY